jgi:hypothetical protein
MCKKTSTIIGLTIATILTAYISALTMSNQAFAINNIDPQNPASLLEGQAGHEAQLWKILAGQEAHLGQVLGGITTTTHHILKGGSTTGLGCVWNPFDPC